MNFPREIRIIASANDWGHGFPVGLIVTAEGPYDAQAGAVNASGMIGMHRIGQVLTARDYEELNASTPEQTEEQKDVAARIKYLYSVQDADGMSLVNTRDREYAREVKSFMGGKKEGVIIMAYAPVKEIR